MSLVAEFTIPPEALPFGETLRENPDVDVEIERIVPTDESALPFFWVRGPHPERFVEDAADEPEITDIRLLDDVDAGALFRAEWSPDASIIGGIRELDGTLLESTGTADGWRFKVRAQDREAFVEFQRIFRERDLSIRLERLYNLSELVEGEHRELTEEQRETLILAYHEGYFDEPRGITQEELGERLDVSYRAVSDRLRRGTGALVASTLLPSADQR